MFITSRFYTVLMVLILLPYKSLGQMSYSLPNDVFQQARENEVVDIYPYSILYRSYTDVNSIDSVYQLLKGNLSSKVEALNTIAYSAQLSRLGNNDQALNIIQTLEENIGDQVVIIQAEYFCTMGTIALGAMKPKFAVKYYKQSVDLVKSKSNVPKEIIQSKVIALGKAYNAILEHEKAQEVFKDAFTYERFGVNRNSLYLRLNVALTNSYLGNYEEAKIYWLKALPMIQSNQDYFAEMRTYGNLGDVYLKQDSLQEAYQWYTLGLKKARAHNFNADVFSFQYAFSDLYYQGKQLDSAYIHLAIADSLRRVYNTNEMARNLIKMELYYQNKAQRLKDKMLKELYVLEQEKRYIFLFVFLLLLIFCALLLWQLIMLYQKNKVLLKQQLKTIQTKAIIERVSNVDHSNLLKELMVEVEENKIFTDASLTLDSLAKQLHTNRTYLSEAINLHYKKSFSQWLNELRVLESKKMLVLAEYDQYSIEGIARNVGFSSISTFNANFKKVTGLTPSYFRTNRSMLLS